MKDGFIWMRILGGKINNIENNRKYWNVVVQTNAERELDQRKELGKKRKLRNNY